MKHRITTSALLLASVVALPSSAIAEQIEFHAGPFQLFVVIPREILRGVISAPWQEEKVAKPVPVPPIPAPVAPAPPTAAVPAPPAPAPAPATPPSTMEQAPTVEQQEHRPTSSYFGPQPSRPYRQQ